MPTSTTCARSSATAVAGSRRSAASATGWPMPDQIDPNVWAAPEAATRAGATPVAAISEEASPDTAEQIVLAEEARLIRRVRWRLVAWSGVSTLVVLVVLAIVLYAAVANTLAAASEQQLTSRV